MGAFAEDENINEQIYGFTWTTFAQNIS
jgi:hypothetical protein